MLETRFRDILACQINGETLKEVLSRSFQDFPNAESFDLNEFRVISKEFPLIRDKVGYQLRYVDILAMNNKKELLIIELKNRYKKTTNPKNVISQIDEYENLLNENVIDLVNEAEFLSIFHYYQKQIFNFMNFPYSELSNIQKVILFIKSDNDLNYQDLNTSVPIGTFRDEEVNLLTKKYTDFQIERIEQITPGYQDLLKTECYSKSPKIPDFRPIPMTSFDNSDLPTFRFESFNSTKSKIVKIENIDLLPEIKLPMLYPEESKRVTINDIFHNLERGDFTIQIFRSGRVNPIYYFEYDSDRYIPFHQIKSRLLQKRELVNKIIAYDASFGLVSQKLEKTIFEDVILFDQGDFTSKMIEDNGVRLKQFTLNGSRYKMVFEMIGPMIRNNISKSELEKNLPPLLPYMERDKIVEQIENYITLYNINPFTDNWIITNIRTKPN
ncbi:hypothetical protein LCGC14_1225240 [marine sediment metagenome]|uniref:Uncharacterized protein n=1 Tax=marine sediment metagenome TaxID=412755 RepID=A0A0F9PEL2_9ZZZZ